MPKLNATTTQAPQVPAQIAAPERPALAKLEPVPAALAAFDQLPDAAYARMPVVAPLISASPATVWRWVKSGRLPAPKKLGPNITAWNVGELRASLAALHAGA